MASLIQGYEYDIFISYRQKDNKGDRWVSEFVEALKTELESTFKEEISVYFDINPHDGLLETHDVEASLEEKLKCLVFIPIISRTYCDPKSFAWRHEFKAFVDQALKDPFGLKVKLPNGNVASRVLPVRIHDLDQEDMKVCESVLGGVLRGIEFIYKEPGVNKPLSSDDDEKKNLNNTKYRIQVNKTANAIKEIISGLKKEPEKIVKEKADQDKMYEEGRKAERKEVQEKPAKIPKRKFLSRIVILAVLIVTAIFAYSKIFKRDTLEKLRSSDERISVAVMPFQNMTNDTTWNIWQEGIQDILFTCLSNVPEELKIRQAESVNNLLHRENLANYASITPSIASKISQKLNADIIIFGSIKQAGPRIRLDAQLIDSRTQETLKAFEIDGPAKEELIFQITDSLKLMVKDFLIISKLKEEIPSGLRYSGSISDSPEALRYYIYGNKAFTSRDYPTARNWYLKALTIDSNLITAAIYIAVSYTNQGLYEEGEKWCKHVYEKIEIVPLDQKLMIKWLYASYFETPYEEIKYLKQSLELDDQRSLPYYILGIKYNELQQFDKAIPEFEKALKLHEKWGIKPVWAFYYTEFGLAYHKTFQYKKEKELYKMAEKDFPDDNRIIQRQAILSLIDGDTVEANDYIQKYIYLSKERSASDASIIDNLAMIYEQAGILDKAEKYYREELSLEPENPVRMNTLAWFLIDNDRNINEGMGLIENALKINPNDYESIDTKGWGLYKRGNYQEALEILQKGWDLRREHAVYNYEAFVHLEEAKKAVAGQK
jgi:tetratricopeptide (TPR) repeat protein